MAMMPMVRRASVKSNLRVLTHKGLGGYDTR